MPASAFGPKPAMIAGHATIGLEVVVDLPDVETVFVPAGGGALACGVGCVIRNVHSRNENRRVQTESYPALAQSFRTDQRYPLLRYAVDCVAVVPEPQVRAAVRLMVLGNRVVSAGAGRWPWPRPLTRQ